MFKFRSELWVMHGFNWSLPVWVCKLDTVMRVRRAGNITALMCQALENKLSEIGTSNGQDWFLTPEMLKKHADMIAPGSGIGADDCISWIRQVGRTVWMDQPKSMEGFYEELARDGFVKSPAAAQVIYTAICQKMLDRLGNKRRPVDLGFAMLEPLPFRADWRDIVTDRASKDLRAGKQTHWQAAMKNAFELLSKGRLFMYCKNYDILLWSITLRHQRTWWKTIFSLEKDRRTRRRRRHYMFDSIIFLKDKTNEILALLLDYVSQARRPHVKFPPGTPHRGPIRRPEVAATQGARLRSFGRYSNAVDHRFGKKVGPQIMAFARARVRKMPNLQQEAEDMRNGGTDVDPSGDSPHGTGGVPLLDSGKGVGPVV